jgi:hypothetical protein
MGRSRTSQPIAAPHPKAGRLRAHVEMLATTIGERNLWQYGALERAAQYISTELTANGYTPQRQTFELAKLPLSNVEAALEGSTQAAETVVVGAHYDTVAGCPGANDNATGVASVLEWRSGSRVRRSRARFASSPSSTKSRRSFRPHTWPARCMRTRRKPVAIA